MNPNNSPEANARLAAMRQRMESGQKYKLPTEAEDQARVVAWLRQHNIRHFHPKNSGLKTMRQASRDRGQGLVAGVPDLIITTRLKNAPYPVAIEMKRLTGGSMSVQQFEWIEHLKDEGWAVKVAEGYSDAINFLESLGYGS